MKPSNILTLISILHMFDTFWLSYWSNMNHFLPILLTAARKKKDCNRHVNIKIGPLKTGKSLWIKKLSFSKAYNGDQIFSSLSFSLSHQIGIEIYQIANFLGRYLINKYANYNLQITGRRRVFIFEWGLWLLHWQQLLMDRCAE